MRDSVSQQSSMEKRRSGSRLSSANVSTKLVKAVPLLPASSPKQRDVSCMQPEGIAEKMSNCSYFPFLRRAQYRGADLEGT